MKTIDYEERLMYSAESFFNPNVDLSFYSEKEIEEMGRQAKEFLTKYEKKYSSLLERAEALDSRRDAIIEPEPEHQSKFRDALVSIMQIKKLDDIDRFFVEMPKDAVRVNGEEQTGLVPTTDAVDAIKNRLEIYNRRAEQITISRELLNALQDWIRLSKTNWSRKQNFRIWHLSTEKSFPKEIKTR